MVTGVHCCRSDQAAYQDSESQALYPGDLVAEREGDRNAAGPRLSFEVTQS